MNILYLTQVLPYPLDAGAKLRVYYVLRTLAQQHAVTLLSFTRPGDPIQAIEHLRSMCSHIITVPMQRSRLRDIKALVRSLTSNIPFLITRDWALEMAAQVEFLIRNSKFDFIHSDQLWMAQYVLRLNVETLKRSNVRTVLDQHNAMYLIPQRMAAEARNPLARWLLKREARLMARYEAQICQQFDHVVWVTQEDYQAVQHQQNLLSQQSTNRKSTIPNPQSIIRNSKSEIRNSIIPICIDPSEIQPVGPLPHEPNILFLGGMHWPPNAEGVRWFVREVFPKVREKIPKTKFFAIGKSPPKELINTQGVVAPGYVEDIETYWKNSRVFVVPLQAGGGMRVKILDAWAHRLPVVSTTIGAEGIKYQEGEDIMIADDPQALAQILVRVLGDIELVQQLAEAGRATVEKHYDWRKVYSSWWDQVYSSLFELSGVL